MIKLNDYKSLILNGLKAILTLLLIMVLSSPGYSDEYTYTSQNKKSIKNYNSAVSYYQMGDYQNAINSLNKSIIYDKNFIEAWLLLGDINADLKKYQEAINAYNGAIGIDSTFFPAVYYFLGGIYYEISEYYNSIISLEIFLNTDNISSEIKALANDKLIRAKTAFKLISNPIPVDIISMGYPVNTPNDEYINYVNVDNDLIMFTKRSPSKSSSKRYVEQLYNSKLSDNYWSMPKLVDLSWRNNTLNMGTINFSTDGKTMYFTGCYWPNGFGSCDIYKSGSVGGKWLPPQNMGSTINTATWDSQPIISSDNKRLYFSSKRVGGKGGSDIWMAIKLQSGQWSPPINMGDSINTDRDEMAPFLHADGKTLYFASTGHPGMGGYDLFVSRQDETGIWSKAKNIGYPTNTKANEIIIFSSLDGKRSWISSDREGGMGKYDIYYFDNYKLVEPQEIMYVRGTVIDKETKKPIKSTIEITNITNGETLNTALSDPVTGEFLIVLLPGIDYAFNISSPGYLFYSENINLATDSTGVSSVNKTFELSPIKSGSQITMNNIFFEFNSSDLLASSYTELDRLVKLLKASKINIYIIGHTDGIGTIDYNNKLSEKRAISVGKYLISKGINPSRLEYMAKGSTEPIADNSTEEGRAKNRRTEILVK
ncbi:MAG: OmpA family protein [Lentimicrobiaceae bacterium]|jgi:outer membrane protein OmpA-like peptidoglycan-associated protein|nr:OmpA family protein [Lentimicrobiaceae bacterium]MBT4062153.1 OmpA family protein [Lentimicrobiaceae bacterium]MBT4190731.1 OmpA family protein [Lentimicrobiaceae bacterium]MBT5163453.1 OmpA family protein [Lentimicrobiaceae bacterium]MBT5669492.1 OmpA family protein [Lentimicrobiaceae bacterium]